MLLLSENSLTALPLSALNKNSCAPDFPLPLQVVVISWDWPGGSDGMEKVSTAVSLSLKAMALADAVVLPLLVTANRYV